MYPPGLLANEEPSYRNNHQLRHDPTAGHTFGVSSTFSIEVLTPPATRVTPTPTRTEPGKVEREDRLSRDVHSLRPRHQSPAAGALTLTELIQLSRYPRAISSPLGVKEKPPSKNSRVSPRGDVVKEPPARWSEAPIKRNVSWESKAKINPSFCAIPVAKVPLRAYVCSDCSTCDSDTASATLTDGEMYDTDDDEDNDLLVYEVGHRPVRVAPKIVFSPRQFTVRAPAGAVRVQEGPSALGREMAADTENLQSSSFAVSTGANERKEGPISSNSSASSLRKVSPQEHAAQRIGHTSPSVSLSPSESNSRLSPKQPSPIPSPATSPPQPTPPTPEHDERRTFAAGTRGATTPQRSITSTTPTRATPQRTGATSPLTQRATSLSPAPRSVVSSANKAKVPLSKLRYGPAFPPAPPVASLRSAASASPQSQRKPSVSAAPLAKPGGANTNSPHEVVSDEVIQKLADKLWDALSKKRDTHNGEARTTAVVESGAQPADNNRKVALNAQSQQEPCIAVPGPTSYQTYVVPHVVQPSVSSETQRQPAAAPSGGAVVYVANPSTYKRTSDRIMFDDGVVIDVISEGESEETAPSRRRSSIFPSVQATVPTTPVPTSPDIIQNRSPPCRVVTPQRSSRGEEVSVPPLLPRSPTTTPIRVALPLTGASPSPPRALSIDHPASVVPRTVSFPGGTLVLPPSRNSASPPPQFPTRRMDPPVRVPAEKGSRKIFRPPPPVVVPLKNSPSSSPVRQVSMSPLRSDSTIAARRSISFVTEPPRRGTVVTAPPPPTNRMMPRRVDGANKATVNIFSTSAR